MDEYRPLTAATIEAIEAMATEPRDTVICDEGSLLSLAASLYWSWAEAVGESAQQADCDRMIFVIAELQHKRRELALLPRRRNSEQLVSIAPRECHGKPVQ